MKKFRTLVNEATEEEIMAYAEYIIDVTRMQRGNAAATRAGLSLIAIVLFEGMKDWYRATVHVLKSDLDKIRSAK